MSQAFATRQASYILKWALRLYPAEKRTWGQAILAEANSISGLGSTLSWAAGGLMVALRIFFWSLFSRLFRGNTAGRPTLIGPGASPPSVNWTFTIVCCAVSGILLCLPEMRQAWNVLVPVFHASLAGDFVPPDQPERWTKLGRSAEAHGDGATMAFAAMQLAYVDCKHLGEGIELARHAVAKDARLTWTYYFLTQPGDGPHCAGSERLELLEALHQWDPTNAVPYLAMAEQAAFSYQRDQQSKPQPALGLKSPEQGRNRYVSDAQKLGPQWNAWMDRAFSSTTYDDYTSKRMDLEQQVLRQGAVPSNDPMNALWNIVRYRIPDIYSLRLYAELSFVRAEEAQSAGDWERTADVYWSIAGFAQRMRLSNERELGSGNIGDLIAAGLEEQSFKLLDPVLLKLNRQQEARVIASVAREEQLQTHTYVRVWEETHGFIGSNASWVVMWAFLMILSALLIAIRLLIFTVSAAGSRFARFVPYASVFLPLSGTGLLIAYRPYYEAFSSFLQTTQGGHYLLEDFRSLLDVAVVLHGVVGNNGAVFFWCTIIVTGTAISVALIGRMLRDRLA